LTGAGAAAVVAAVIVTGWAAPAWAHVQVSADKAQAGATDVTVTFTGEAESSKAGIKSERVVLPDGITPQQVRLGKAPRGWAYTSASDGFTVGGMALPIGTDAVWSVVVDRLPTGATELPFKTIETYGDGEAVRWIEIPVPGQAAPDNPAPVLEVKAAAAAAPTTAGPTTAGPTPPAAVPTGPGPAVPAADPGHSPGWVIALSAVVLLAVVVAGGLAMRRHRSR
jgi:uncharacterized protein YcnI